LNTKNGLSNQIWLSNGRSENPDKDELKPITGETYHPIKPIGGLWTSTYTPKKEFDSDWIKWCVQEDFCVGRHKWLMKTKENLDVLVVDSMEDLRDVVEAYQKKKYKGSDTSNIDATVLDFLQIASDFDAMHLTKNGQKETTSNYKKEPNLNSWDTETVLNFQWNWTEYNYLGVCESIDDEGQLTY
jgi:hypothetical protein